MRTQKMRSTIKCMTISNKKTVLHIAPTPFFSDRGCHIRIEGIVRCLNNLGYNNLICTYHNGREVNGVKTKRIGIIKTYTKTEAGPNKYKFWADLKLTCLSLKQYYQLKPSAIHAHLHEGLFIAIIIKTLFFWRKTPLIADLQGSFTGELETYNTFKKRPWLKALSLLFERSTLYFANHILCSSKHAYQQTKKLGKINSDNIDIVQDGADEKTILPAEKRQSLKYKLGLEDGKTIVVYSGALLNGKGLQALKETVQGLSKYQSSLHFLIIGYPVDDLEHFLKKQKISSFCTVVGRVNFDTLSDYLQLADIAIDPKRSDAGEASGKIINYLSCGLPVVAFDTQNNRSFLGSDPILANNNTELQGNILLYQKDINLRQKIALSSKKRFLQSFSWKTSQQHLQRVYAKIVNYS